MTDDRSEGPHPGRIMLATPTRFDPAALAPRLADALATGEVGCVRIDLPGAEEDEIRAAADALRPVCHAADVAIILSGHYRLAAQLGLDGAEVEARGVKLRDARAELGKDAILGAACGDSRHAGMTAAEAGVDYVLFRPYRAEGDLGDGTEASLDLFQWWAEMIETPVVAEGGIEAPEARELAPYADFIIPSVSIWEDDVAAAVRAFARIIEVAG
ncbi:thiamine phosphate synthase [Rhodovulum sp. DZ06]|uniref:thiamine phosphate synthase n=1 Tax=Rhodovulum sp. DZ06 TaxID=3425126 RepID=UPI003D34E3A8